MADAPEAPEELLYLWRIHLDLRGGEPLTYSEIAAANELLDLGLQPQEVEILKVLDNVRWKVIYE